MYRIESSRGDDKWIEEEVLVSPHTNLDDLSIWIKAAQNMDSFGGKYEYRVVDETDKEFYHSKNPYEGMRIDIISAPDTWLDKIRYDYGIKVETWKQACIAWLEWEKSRQDSNVDH